MKRYIAFILFLAVVLNSCSIEKRIYQPGYFISGRSSSPKEEKIQKKIPSEIFSESATTVANNESSAVIDHEDTTRIKFNESCPIIVASNETKILPQEFPVSNELINDSIPEDSKLLLEKYKKNHNSKMNLRKIAIYPIALFTVGFLGVLVILIPWANGTAEDNVILAFLIVCLVALILLAPLALLFLITSIVTKKQRRKLRKMGLMK